MPFWPRRHKGKPIVGGRFVLGKGWENDGLLERRLLRRKGGGGGGGEVLVDKGAAGGV